MNSARFNQYITPEGQQLAKQAIDTTTFHGRVVGLGILTLFTSVYFLCLGVVIQLLRKSNVEIGTWKSTTTPATAGVAATETTPATAGTGAYTTWDFTEDKDGVRCFKSSGSLTVERLKSMLGFMITYQVFISLMMFYLVFKATKGPMTPMTGIVALVSVAIASVNVIPLGLLLGMVKSTVKRSDASVIPRSEKEYSMQAPKFMRKSAVGSLTFQDATESSDYIPSNKDMYTCLSFTSETQAVNYYNLAITGAGFTVLQVFMFYFYSAYF